jgi:DNA-binding NarL/FixJ family response regulator
MAKHVSIVDDNQAIRRTLRYLFKENPQWTICGEATNGRDALEKAHALQPDLVILDFSMPVMNGLETASLLKKNSPKLPIVMLTAFKDRFLEQQAFHAGVSWVLSKTGGRQHGGGFRAHSAEHQFPAGARRGEEERELFHCNCDVDA